MKKLLSLLSVLTISGSAVPITIAASPYQKKEQLNNEINYLETNNLKKLNRNKRERNEAWRLSDKILSVPKIRQLSGQWCGPAIGESILRYFGLNTDSTLLSINRNYQRTSYTSFQHYLADSMRTITNQNLNPDLTRANSKYNYFGTTVDNWTNVMNNFINQYNLNSQRLYSITPVRSHVNIDNISNIIRNSLQNNTPVALAYRGNLPEYFTEEGGISNHFIIINGITGIRTNTMREQDQAGSNLTFHYMDPWTGTSGTFDSTLLRLLVSNENNQGQRLESYLISHIPNTLSQIQTPRLNQTELMEIGNCNKNIVLQFINENLHCNTLTRFKRNNLNCPDINNPYFEDGDYFRVYNRGGHDGIELKISLKTAAAFDEFFHKNKSLKTKDYLKKLINSVEQKDETGWLGSIQESDKESMKFFLFSGYNYFHDRVLEFISDKRYTDEHSIFIRTWRNWEWKDLNSDMRNKAIYIAKNSLGDHL